MNSTVKEDAWSEHIVKSPKNTSEDRIECSKENTSDSSKAVHYMKYSVNEESMMMGIWSESALWNHTSVYLLSSLYLGNNRLFKSIIPPYSSISCPS